MAGGYWQPGNWRIEQLAVERAAGQLHVRAARLRSGVRVVRLGSLGVTGYRIAHVSTLAPSPGRPPPDLEVGQTPPVLGFWLSAAPRCGALGLWLERDHSSVGLRHTWPVAGHALLG
ncbi:hypothetical protein, partial [Streptomyces sp. NPDC018352]|uniref:hypothetical protein n=1 Tax=Streptomyces sp. NPDC018352 TaxID=3157194 RepID=UPI0033E7E634